MSKAVGGDYIFLLGRKWTAFSAGLPENENVMPSEEIENMACLLPFDADKFLLNDAVIFNQQGLDKEELNLLRLSTLRLMLRFCSAFNNMKKKVFCRNNETLKNQRLITMLDRLEEFLSTPGIIRFMLEAFLSDSKFVLFTANDIFTQYALDFPNILLSCNSLSEKIVNLCSKDPLAFMELICNLANCLYKLVTKKNDGFPISHVNLFSDSLEIMNMLLASFNKSYLQSERNNREINKLSSLELHCKHKMSYKLLKLHKSLSTLSTGNYLEIFMISLEQKETFSEPKFSMKLSTCLSFIKDTIDTAISINNCLSFNGIFQYSAKYLFKAILYSTECIKSFPCGLQYADDVIDVFLQWNVSAIDRGEEREHCLTKVAGFIVPETESEEENSLISSSLANMRLFIIVILKSCSLFASQERDSEVAERAKLRAKLDECIVQLYTLLSYLCPSKTRVDDATLSNAEIWLHFLMAEDDKVFDVMLYLLQIYVAIQERNQSQRRHEHKTDIVSEICPHRLFHHILHEVSFDHLVCVDWLITQETCFERVFLIYLDIVTSDFNAFLFALESVDVVQEPSDSYCSSTDDDDDTCTENPGLILPPSTNPILQRPDSNKLISMSIGEQNTFQTRSKQSVKSGCGKSNTCLSHPIPGVSERPPTSLAPSQTEQAIAAYDIKTTANNTDACDASQSHISLTTEDTQSEPDSLSVSAADVHLCDNSTNLAAEQLIDLFIRLRIKLERFAEKSLSTRSFELLINKLGIVEDLFEDLETKS